MASGDGDTCVAVIVVNWNDAGDTIACLDSLTRISVPSWRAYVVDNASSDDSVLRIAEAHAEAVVIKTAHNLGYAGGFNIGLAKAIADGAPFVFLLNNDATLETETLRLLMQAHAEVAMPALLSPKILHASIPKQVWYGGGGLDWRLKSHHIDEGNPDRPEDTALRPAAWATGCALFCSTDVARRIGPMDERYFLYLEDVDWSLRAKACGVSIFYVPRARVTHTVSQSVQRLHPGTRRYYGWRNYYLLVRQHGRWWQRALGYADLISRLYKTALRYLFFPAYRHDPLYRARTRALLDFLRGRLGEGRL